MSLTLRRHNRYLPVGIRIQQKRMQIFEPNSVQTKQQKL